MEPADAAVANIAVDVVAVVDVVVVGGGSGCEEVAEAKTASEDAHTPLGAVGAADRCLGVAEDDDFAADGGDSSKGQVPLVVVVQHSLV